MKIKKQQNLKKKIDKQKAAEEEQVIVDDIIAIYRKGESIDLMKGYIYVYLKEKGYPITFRAGKHIFNTKEFAPSLELFYKGKHITSCGLKTPKKYIKIHGKKISYPLYKRGLFEILQDKPDHGNLDTNFIFYEKETLREQKTELYMDAAASLRGYNAEGHPVQRLVARADIPLTYDEARTILRTTDMSEPMVCGVECRFNEHGHLMTVF